jgi:dihydropteroate synthase
MTSSGSQLLINQVSADIARSYLQRTFGWRPDSNGHAPLTVFIQYFDKLPPTVYVSAVKTFPNHCQIIQTPNRQSVFLIAANLLSFSRITALFSAADEQRWLQDIELLLEGLPEPRFRIRDQTWCKDRPRIMSILNITPDSFYDGGHHYQCDDYGAIADRMIQAGADIIDIGGESSRPGALAVSEEEEMNRVLKAVSQIRQRFHIPISIDTVKPVVADAALSAGANMVNDISGLAAGFEMLQTVRKHDAGYCLMHIQGTPENMQQAPRYGDIIGEIHQFFQTKLRLCEEAGLEKDRILLDPGIGFGKTVLNNMDILRLLPAFSNLGCLLLLGTSNKSFIGKILKRDTEQRLHGTMASQALGWIQGASMFRVHSIEETRDTLEIARCHTAEF